MFHLRAILLIGAILAWLGTTVPVQAGPPPVSSNTSVSATIPFPTGDLRLIGYASPNALVTFLRSGTVAGTAAANSAGLFDKTLTGLDPGVQTFSLYGSDVDGKTTLTLSFETNIMSGITLTLSGFLLPPTISVRSETFKRTDPPSTNGRTRIDSTVTAFFNSDPISKQVEVDSAGRWSARITDVFHLGTHTTNALVQDHDGSQSVVSQTLQFLVEISADLNNDTKVNLTDFSILMFNYGRSSPPNKLADINDNGPVDLVDFSVMMFYWTGSS